MNSRHEMAKKGEPNDGSKLKKWLRFYLDDKNPSTFLQKTASAKAADYKCTSNVSFASVGCQNFNKLKLEIETWLDELGFSRNALKIKLLSLIEGQETKILTIKGKIKKENLPPNVTIITESVIIKTKKDLEDIQAGIMFPDVETVIGISMDNKELQRRSLDMALKVIPGGYAPTNTNHNIESKGGVLVVPGVMTADQWEDIAKNHDPTKKDK